MPGHLEFDVRFGRTARRQGEGEPMRLLVLGDFSGRPSSERPPLAERPAHRLDLDTFDDVMRRVGPRMVGDSGDITFSEIDDFHPDRLYSRLARFEALREARSGPPPGTGDLLQRLLGGQSGPAATPREPSTGLDALIRKIVEPHIVKDTLAHSNAYQAAVDTAIAGEMRRLLHDPGFQAIEAAWRGVHWLVSSLELDERLQLHLLDVTRDEIARDLAAAQGALPQTGLYRALVDRWRGVPGAEGWSVLVCLMQFGASDADAGLLAALARIASQAGGPLLAGAAPDLAGDAAGHAAAWESLRRSEAARWIGLAAPRVLLRQPYGRASDPVEAFAFEEFAGPPVHEHLLWGSGSLAAALLIARAFTARGWDMEPGDEREIPDLPAYTFERDGERDMQACAERYLTEREIHALLTAGLIPLASRRDRNGLVAIRFQSIAEPAAPLTW